MRLISLVFAIIVLLGSSAHAQYGNGVGGFNRGGVNRGFNQGVNRGVHGNVGVNRAGFRGNHQFARNGNGNGNVTIIQQRRGLFGRRGQTRVFRGN